VCGREYQPTNPTQKYCAECGPVANRVRVAKWCKANPEKRKAHKVKWCKGNPEYHAKWAKANPEKAAKWAKANPEKCRATWATCRSANPEKYKAMFAKWCKANPEKRRLQHAKAKAKHRTLGCTALNQPFVGSQGHHVDQDRILYIPTDLHRSVSHNIWTGRNMDKINALAYQWAQLQQA
jgi:hypothetical protein